MPLVRVSNAVLVVVIALLLGLSIGTARPHRAEAASFTVNSTADAVDVNANDHICLTSTPGECTLRAAIQQANASGGGDITIPAGTYVLTIPGANEDAAASGDLDINVPLRIMGYLGANTIVDGGGLDRVFDVAPGVPLVSPIVEFDDITIRGGAGVFAGGGVANHGAQLGIQRAILTGNLADDGGALADLATPNDSGHVGIFSSTIDDNRANVGGGLSNHHIMAVELSTVVNNHQIGVGGGGGISNAGNLLVFESPISENSALNLGGGLANDEGAMANVQGSTISSNSANTGGGVFNSGHASLVRGSIVRANTAQTQGGGIYNGPGGPAAQASVEVVESSVVDNTSALGGGGIYNEANLSILPGSHIDHNSDLSIGGGIASGNFASTYVQGSTLSYNSSTYGGGVFMSSGGDIFLQNSTIQANSAQSGGGVYLVAATASFSSLLTMNATFSGNVVTGDGGGIGGEGDTDIRLFSTTVAGNVADSDGDGHGDGGGIFATGDSIEIANTIVALNTDTGGEAPDCAGFLFSAGYNLVQSVSGCQVGGDTETNIIGIDPMLLPLADNGGPTLTHALAYGSPAVDHANPAALNTTDACDSTDQRGSIRPVDGDGNGIAICDIGAYELEAAIAPATSTPTLAAISTATPTATNTNTSTPTVTSTLTASPTATPSPTNTTGVPSQHKTCDPQEAATNTGPGPSCNLYICQSPAPCGGPGEGDLTVIEHVNNVQTNPPALGLGAYEFNVEFDSFVIQSVNPADIIFSAGSATAGIAPAPSGGYPAGYRGAPDCSMSIVFENSVRFGCVTSGQNAGPAGSFDLAKLDLIPAADDVKDLFPGNDNGIPTLIKDNQCELADTLGHPVVGAGAGLLPTCGDLYVTVRILEGDLNLDCKVDVLDEALIASHDGAFFGSALYQKWFDLEPRFHDLDIDIKDLQKVFGRDGSTCQVPIPAQTPVPPPFNLNS